MFIKDNEKPHGVINAKEAMNLCMAYLWENIIEPGTEQGIVNLDHAQMLEEIGETLTILGQQAYLYEKSLDIERQNPYSCN